MSIISNVGRKAWTTRTFIAGIYLVLTLGAITVLYPIGLMIGASICGAVDVSEHRLVPRYPHNDEALFLKYIKQGVNIQNLNDCYRPEFLS
jgi:hypothetical protein